MLICSPCSPFLLFVWKKTPFQLSKVSKVSNFGHPYHCEFSLFYIWKKTKWARWALSKVNIFCSMLTSAHPFFTLNKIYIYYKNKDAQICSFAHLAHPFFITYKKNSISVEQSEQILDILITVNSPYFIYRKKLSEQGEHWAKYFLLNAHVCSPFFYVK